MNQIFVTTVALDAAGATVRVHFGADFIPPTAPTNLVGNASDGSVTLGWQPSTDNVSVAGYRVLRDGLTVGTASSTTWVDRPPAQAATYSYSVAAVDQSGNASSSVSIGVYVPDSIAPSAADSFTATQTDQSTVALAWTKATDNVAVAGYTVNRDGATLGSTADVGFVDASVSFGDEHSYSLVAFDAAGNVGPAVTVAVNLADVTRPAVGGTLDASVSGSTVTLSWPEATDNGGIDHYAVARDGVLIASIGAPGYVDADLAQGVTYSYAVTAVDRAGLSADAVTTTAYVPDATAPGRPSVAADLTRPDSASLHWDGAVDNVGVDHYVVFRDGTWFADVTATETLEVDVDQGRSYVFTVFAVDAAGNVSEASDVTLTVPDVTPPTPPAVSATATGSTSVSLAWTVATDNVGVARYDVIRDESVVASLAPDATSYAQTGLASDRAFTYSIRVYDGAGNFTDSLPASVSLVSPDTRPPSAPSALNAKAASGRRVTLTWGAGSDDRAGAIRYMVFRGTTRIATVTTLSFVDRTPKVATYRYRVRAVDAVGNKGMYTAYYSVRSRR